LLLIATCRGRRVIARRTLFTGVIQVTLKTEQFQHIFWKRYTVHSLCTNVSWTAVDGPGEHVEKFPLWSRWNPSGGEGRLHGDPGYPRPFPAQHHCRYLHARTHARAGKRSASWMVSWARRVSGQPRPGADPGGWCHIWCRGQQEGPVTVNGLPALIWSG